MHEMALAENVLQIILEASQTGHFSRVKTVFLEIGKLSAVEPDALRFCFDAVTRDTLVAHAELEIIEVAGIAHCQNCATDMTVQEKYGLCPNCGSAQLQIIAGNQMRVKELSVE